MNREKKVKSKSNKKQYKVKSQREVQGAWQAGHAAVQCTLTSDRNIGDFHEISFSFSIFGYLFKRCLDKANQRRRMRGREAKANPGIKQKLQT